VIFGDQRYLRWTFEPTWRQARLFVGELFLTVGRGLQFGRRSRKWIDQPWLLVGLAIGGKDRLRSATQAQLALEAAHQELDRLGVARQEGDLTLTVKGRIALLATGTTLPDWPMHPSLRAELDQAQEAIRR
jgi:hypothetical protein